MKETRRDNDKLLVLCNNCLLHLYLKISVTGAFISPAARNEILVQFLKPKVKSAEYKTVKKEVKFLIKVGRSKMKLESNILKLKLLTMNLLNAVE